MSTFKTLLTMSFISVLGTGLCQRVIAGCPCNKGESHAGYQTSLAPVADPGYQTAYAPPVHYSQPAYGYGQMEPTGQSYYRGPSYSPNSISVFSQLMGYPYSTQVMSRATPTPPPGTIGQTFKLPSRPVPVEKHPRVGMLDVKIADAHNVIVHDMNAMRTEDTIDGFKDAKIENIWHFESKPLYPGLDHIYRVQATFKNDDGTERKAEKYVRLIMGRVVELTF